MTSHGLPPRNRTVTWYDPLAALELGRSLNGLEFIEAIIRGVLTRPRDPAGTAGDVADMRRAIAQEKGEDDIWDLKQAAGGLVADVTFAAFLAKKRLHRNVLPPAFQPAASSASGSAAR